MSIESPIKIKKVKHKIKVMDWKGAMKTALLFLAPLVLIYLTQVTGLLSQEGHIFKLKDFYPTNFTWGAIALYLTNRITDIITRFQQAK